MKEVSILSSFDLFVSILAQVHYYNLFNQLEKLKRDDIKFTTLEKKVTQQQNYIEQQNQMI